MATRKVTNKKRKDRRLKRVDLANPSHRKGFLNTVLHNINLGRKALGMLPLNTLPKGVVENCRFCVIALCFDAELHNQKVLTPNRNPQPYSTFEMWKVCQMEASKRLASIWETETLKRSPGVFLPVILQQFVRLFDRGKFPELEIEIIMSNEL